jgi:DNA repair protein RadC
VYVRELVATYQIRGGWVTRHTLTAGEPQTAASMFAQVLGEEAVEIMGMFCLSAKYRVIAYHEVHRGGVRSSLVYPRDVFKAALLANAAAVVVGHNHPSGDPEPSPEDRAVTRRLVGAGEVIGVAVLDHIIVGHGGRFFSFKKAGAI